jgi:hypothetical protein
VNYIRGKQSDDWLKLSHDRKVSPQGYWQKADPNRKSVPTGRWVPLIPNSFGLPAGETCPGKTKFCESCYAANTENYSPQVRNNMLHNLRLLTEAATVDGMALLIYEMISRYVAEAERRDVAAKDMVFRIHWDGDFFSLDYAVAWATAMCQFPLVQFWTYTRSFREPVDVVPVLSQVPNLTLYISVDQYNIEAANRYPDVRRAACADDYLHARDLAPEALPCPENSGKMRLMNGGRGACTDCKWCITGKRDILFSISHKENEYVQPLLIPEFKHHLGICKLPDCSNEVLDVPGRRGPKPEYCCTEHRWAMRKKKYRTPEKVS